MGEGVFCQKRSLNGRYTYIDNRYTLIIDSQTESRSSSWNLLLANLLLVRSCKSRYIRYKTKVAGETSRRRGYRRIIKTSNSHKAIHNFARRRLSRSFAAAFLLTVSARATRNGFLEFSCGTCSPLNPDVRRNLSCLQSARSNSDRSEQSGPLKFALMITLLHFRPHPPPSYQDVV